MEQFNTSPKKPFTVVIISIVITAIIVGSAVYWITNRQKISTIQSNNQAVQIANSVKDVHHWNAQPVEVKDLDLAKTLFGVPDGYVKAWDVGTYSDGYRRRSQLNGTRIILVALKDNAFNAGPFGTEGTEGACESFGRILVSKYPSGLFVGYSLRYSPDGMLADRILNFISKDRSSIVHFEYNNTTSDPFIPSLDFPGFIVHDGQTFVIQRSSPCHVIDAEGKTNIFFDDIKSSLQPTFTDPMLGTAYADKATGDIIFRAADGTYIRYNSF